MSKITKNIIALSISSALSIGFINSVNAATYLLVEEGDTAKVEYTYGQQQNIHGDMVISGTNVYNFPVQFDYLDENDFDNIQIFAAINHNSFNTLNDIEDATALRSGNPTANDLAWVVLWLEDTAVGKGQDREYQKVGGTINMTDIDGNIEDYNVWDIAFEGTNQLTRSTIDIISGITDSGISYGTATAPFLPITHTQNEQDIETTFWIREFGQRGFYSFNNGANVFPIIPIDTDFSGGISSILDVNESGIAVGYSSHNVSDIYTDFIENGAITRDEQNQETDSIRNISGISDFVQFDLNNKNDGLEDDFTSEYVIRGCNDPYILRHIPYDICVSYVEQSLSSQGVIPYEIIAIKSTLSTNGNPVTEKLGLLVTPHEDDERSYSSYALAINDSGVAVGYADGFYNEEVITPAVDERQFYQYAVVYKNGDVIDLSGDHSDSLSSIAYDINNAGIAVGHITNNLGVRKFFYVDTNAPKEQINMVTPNDYFTGSDSSARAINNSGLIVGEGEIETHNESSSNPRRTAAFVYDINNDVFTNLNDTIPCALQQTYDITEARGINDAGVISATAVVKVDRRDAKGEVILDDNGIPLREDVVRAISLEPVPDTAEVCTAEQENKVERKGASISFVGLLSIMALFGLRRRFFN
jgi:hypothetical protein